MANEPFKLDLGANIQGNGIHFKVWAPLHSNLSINLIGKGEYPLQRDTLGFFSLTLEEAKPHDQYFYQFENGLERPDPVSRSLPKGVDGPTEIIDPNHFQWKDLAWKGIDLRESIFYELHVGTFTPHGTFDGVIEKLPYLKELGINMIEIMPIAQFPGRWNWGYDPASLYAPYSGYGGVDGFKRLVESAHRAGIGICLDVVYNHFGPEGNYLGDFSSYYFSENYHTPWGKALNYDGPYSDPVRNFIIQNALYWITEYHIDALRLDAIHGIYDFSAKQMLPQLVEEVRRLKLDRKVDVIAENDLNDSRAMRSKEQGGWDMSALWNDDFHHSVHVALTGEKTTYYQDFTGLEDVVKAIAEGYVYGGKYSLFRKKTHGSSTADIALEKFVIFTQNHDQVGNRPFGNRLSTLISKELQKIEACMLLMTPSIPLLFMGQEYGEVKPFEYFVDYQNEELMHSIHEGRKREFHREEMPFPGKTSFDSSTLQWSADLMDRELLILYQKLIALRKNNLPKEGLKGEGIHVHHSMEEKWLAWEYLNEKSQWIGVLCYLGQLKNLVIPSPFQGVRGEILLSTRQSKIQDGTLILLPESALIIM